MAGPINMILATKVAFDTFLGRFVVTKTFYELDNLSLKTPLSVSILSAVIVEYFCLLFHLISHSGVFVTASTQPQLKLRVTK